MAHESAGEERLLLDADGVGAALRSLADCISSQFRGSSDSLALLGVRTRGATIAERLQPMVEKRLEAPVKLGTLDITLYRDDLSTLGPQPLVRDSEIHFDLDAHRIILVDDVLFTGRTVRASLDEIVDYGRPRLIRLCVLVDRGLREYPVQADFVALRLETKANQIVKVRLVETDGVDEVVLVTLPTK